MIPCIYSFGGMLDRADLGTMATCMCMEGKDAHFGDEVETSRRKQVWFENNDKRRGIYFVVLETSFGVMD